MRRHLRATAGALGMATSCLGLGAMATPVPATTTVPSVAAAGLPGPLGTMISRPAVIGGPAIKPPPTRAQCVAAGARYGIVECLTPGQVRGAYGVSSLIARGDQGRGQTIVIIDSFGSPTIAGDLRTFDAGYHLPNPPSLRVLAPLGRVPFHASNGVQAGWAGETTLDVEWAHAMAPAAGIVVLTSPVAETEGTVGLGDFLGLEQYALSHRLGQIITQSWAATENTLETAAGRALVARFERFYARADLDHFTILASSGDGGSKNASNGAGTKFYARPTVNFPASSPLITAVGGTALRATPAGRWISEKVWNDGHGRGAGGGGISQLFAEPGYQKGLPASVQKTLAGHRGVPDVAWNSAESTSILTYDSYTGPKKAGWYFTYGTSEASPQWAGMIADINQARRNPIGFLNRILYRLGESTFHDITVGTNAYGGVAGYAARPDWDPASGLGTPRAGALIGALIMARSTA